MTMHPQSIRSQAGITFFGGVILIFFIGLFVLAIIRLVPIYSESFNVGHALTGLQSGVVGGVSDAAIRSSLGKRFDVDDVHSVSPADADITVDNKVVTVRISYAAETSYLGNLGLVVHFDKSVQLTATDTP